MRHSVITFFLSACALFGPALAADRPAQPNVILILTDDLGWQDVGCYDVDEPCPFDTPRIDQLAAEGVQFMQGYSPAPTCAPTRVAILSGKHPARSQKTHVVGGKPPSPYSDRSPVISPWYSGRMPVSDYTLGEALQDAGYATGCVGKWHCAISHHAFPQPPDHGFSFSRMNLGVTRRMNNRLKDFATADEGDPYRLDANGFPRHENSEDALVFLKESKAKPFFLYYATWLVHTPIHTRSERLLKKYCERMGVDMPTDPTGWPIEGQKNPYYGAMVETLDYHVGRIHDYLKETDDPRWPGHKLIENTYLIFTSDNGGMERVPGEQITDNYPLDKGKINVQEGGIRVPLIVIGPDVPAGKQSHTIINGLDFYPTILSWTGTKQGAEVQLDGIDLSAYLASDLEQRPKRDEMLWHFPHSGMQTSLRKGSYKLTRNWRQYLGGAKGPKHELYQLYDEETGTQRVDIEEAQNLAAQMPEKAKELEALLDARLDEMSASQPFLSPDFTPAQPGAEHVAVVTDTSLSGQTASIHFSENGAKVVRAQIIWTDNGGAKYEEWYRQPATIDTDGQSAKVTLPEGTTHYVWNLVDENHYLVSHPKMRTEKESKENYSVRALAVSE